MDEVEVRRLVGDAVVLERAARIVHRRWREGTSPDFIDDTYKTLLILGASLRVRAEDN